MINKHNGICDECGSFKLVFDVDGYDCKKCGYEGSYEPGE